MPELKLELPDNRTAFEPGEEIEVIVGWKCDEPPEAVELRTAWTTRGKGDRDLEVVSIERIEGCGALDGRRQRLILPRSPYSFSGKLISLNWFIEAVLLPSGNATHIDVVIAPGAREVELRQHQAANATA
jgi:hypothetical protein